MNQTLRHTWKSLVSTICGITLLSPSARAADPFAEGVRTTDPLPPEAQQRLFKLPPGFEIQLVAAEPEIRKPMNLAFDGRGRLWVSESREYPFPAPLDKPGRDSIRIFSDFDENGRARKMSVFAEGLNIPIGIYPWRDGVIAWSIPNVWFFRDTDGDGKADQREVLFGPLGWERDTHGNVASFKRGFDGWLYGTHGFNNNTTFRAKDGGTLTLNSGNTYRFRLDGSRIEPHTWGQVNPFGTAWDPAGNLYTSDCHSAPIYQLLAGGYYPSFGKPHDGLGFAPSMMEHAHGSTAIDGMFYYSDNLWPEEFQDNTLIGNVMTSRLNRDRITFSGSTPKANELADFLSTQDPWFRPVDNQLGPDGALYIADFYNRIIGHYEVPLLHPGRDRERGRIWRVIYRGADGKPRLHRRPLDLATASSEQLVKELADPNLTWRLQAMNELCDRLGSTASGPMQSAMDAPTASPLLVAHGLWVLHRVGSLDVSRLVRAMKHADRLVRVHAMRVLTEMRDWPRGVEALALSALQDTDALVRRCAVEALGKHPGDASFGAILELAETTPSSDTHLEYVIRKSIRDHLLSGSIAQRALTGSWTRAQSRRLAEAALGAQTEAAGRLALQTADLWKADEKPRLFEALRHAARLAPAEEMGKLAAFATKQTDLDSEWELYGSVEQGLKQRGGARPTELDAWSLGLARRLVDSVGAPESAWRNIPSASGPSIANPWGWEERRCSDGATARLLSSLAHGEALAGALRSPVFKAPEKLSFYLAGHDGNPEKPALGNNFARLKSAETDEVLLQAPAPRQDTAQRIVWDLSRFRGREVYLEIADHDTGNAYAWLAFGRLDPQVVPWPKLSPAALSKRQTVVAEIALATRATELETSLRRWMRSSSTDVGSRAAAALALAASSKNMKLRVAAEAAGDNTMPSASRVRIAEEVLAVEGANLDAWSRSFWKSSPHRAQVRLAAAFAAHAPASLLLDMAESGEMPRLLLREPVVRDRFNGKATDDEKRRLTGLVEKLPPADAARDRLIEERRKAFNPALADAVRGAAIFSQNCKVCHRIGQDGGVVGPQLDGVGSRGLERLLEDVLDTNRNVDRAFRTRVITFKDDEVASGLLRREEGKVVVIADASGREISIPKERIRSMTESETSLMPENFGEALTENALADLMAFLLEQRAARKE